jgi:hypothetical protein
MSREEARVLARAFAAGAMLCACAPVGLRAREQATAPTTGMNAARALDQEGVRSFREGRYADAVAYFQAAYKSGGPSSELWNIARTREKMDDVEGATETLDAYLALKDLSPQDRAEAQREGQALRDRPSIVTVVTDPPGAAVAVDGKPAAGATPLSVEVRAGSHAVAVRRAGYAPETRDVQARLGRAVIVTLDLARADK